MIHKEESRYETYSDFSDERFEGIYEKRRLWRVPDILSVCLQNVLHGRKSEM